MATGRKACRGSSTTRLRTHAEFYRVDRPLSAEVEIIENDLGSDETMREVIFTSAHPRAG